MIALFFVASLALPQSSPPEDSYLAEAEAWFARGEPEQAVQVLEAACAARPGAMQLQRSLAQALERAVDGGAPWSGMSAAREAWDRALALAPQELENQRGAIAVRLRLGEYESALALAERALGSAWLSGGSAPPALLELACRARLGVLPAPGGAEAGAAEAEARERALREAWKTLGNARALAGDSLELVRLTAGLLQSEGLVARAVEELVLALTRVPAAAELHRALIELHVAEGVEERLGPLYEGWSGSGTNATLAWFSGEAWRLSGELAQRERRFAAALEAYERCGQWMGVAATLDPDLGREAEAVRFRAQVAAGWCELESHALDAASARLLGLLRAHLARRDEPDGLGRTLRAALAELDELRARRHDFGRAADEARAVVALLPDDGPAWAALGARLCAHALQLEAGLIEGVPEREREPRSRALFRESWQASRRAAALLPEDARVLVEAAAVQVHHLRDNLAEAEALLERALELCETRLAELGEGATEAQRVPVIQAREDACADLGHLCYHVYRQPERARTYLERVSASDPAARPEVAALLAALDGQRGPVPEPERAARTPLGPPARVFPPWEASLVEARARARAEGRVLLVVQRGDGLGRARGELERLVLSPEFARASSAAVLLLADGAQETFVERRHDGRRVSCPRFGTVTCGEHRRVDAEVRAWLEGILGSPVGAAQEGLWLLAPDAERPEHLGVPADLAPLAARPALEASARPGAGPFEALEASLGGEAGGSEARDLVATQSLEARLVVERILWEGFRSSPARGFLLAALAEDAGPYARALLAACVRQGHDPELARAALSVWPVGGELEPVLHAWRWSPAPEVRAAAEPVLRRERPADPLWRAREILLAR